MGPGDNGSLATFLRGEDAAAVKERAKARKGAGERECRFNRCSPFLPCSLAPFQFVSATACSLHLLLLLSLTGCVGFSRHAAPADLTARVNGAHIDLSWTNRTALASGYFVEYGNPGIPDFILLDVLRPDADHFRHRDVAPGTTFLYRIRPYFGPTSAAARVATGRVPEGRRLKEADGPLEKSSARGEAHSIRAAGAASNQGAPRGLTAMCAADSTSVDLRWRDHASDEEGYFIEMKLPGEPDFRICALLEPDTASWRLTGLPEQTTLEFRVRAFFHGRSSNIARVTTSEARR